MRCITALTNSGLAFLVILALVAIAWAGESNATGSATGAAQLWSTCFARGPYPTVYVSAVLPPPWTDEKPKAFSAFITKKYGVSTYQPTCLSAVSKAELKGTVAQQMEVYKTVPVVQTGWTYAR
jgi:hypothetical protein